MRYTDYCGSCGCFVPDGVIVCRECSNELTRDDMKFIIRNYMKTSHRGKERAIFSRDLEEKFSLPGRELRRIISELRQEGCPICSDYHTGYFYAANQAEINRTVKGLNEHAAGICDTMRNLKGAQLKDKKGIITIKFEINLDDPDSEPVMIT